MVDRLIIGLGNPGGKYAQTRHNIGFRCIDGIAHRFNFQGARRLFKAQVTEGVIAGKRVVLAKPQTFMNLSGEAVRDLVRWYKLSHRDLLVIYDDLDLPLGRIRIRQRGSAGGHKGMQSVVQHLKTMDIPRLRVGIARPGTEGAIEYVLATFAPEEKPIVEAAISRAIDAVETLLTEGIVAAMNKYNPPPQEGED